MINPSSNIAEIKKLEERKVKLYLPEPIFWLSLFKNIFIFLEVIFGYNSLI